MAYLDDFTARMKFIATPNPVEKCSYFICEYKQTNTHTHIAKMLSSSDSFNSYSFLSWCLFSWISLSLLRLNFLSALNGFCLLVAGCALSLVHFYAFNIIHFNRMLSTCVQWRRLFNLFVY